MTSKLFLGSVAVLAVGALGVVSLTLANAPAAKTALPWGGLTKPAQDAAAPQTAAALDGVDKTKLLKLASYSDQQDAGKAATADAVATPDSASAVEPADTAAQGAQPSASNAAAPAVAAAPVEASRETVPTPAGPTRLASADAEPDAVPAAKAAPASAVPAPKLQPGAGLDLNHASADALDQLPGVGRVGRAIVSHRPYRSVEDLVHKRVLRTSDFQKIRSKVRVD